ncbi:MAG: MFS transporter [Candidatus Izimaplasma sp.]|nr:MFS transporter [Candidatus Izimaplasma bacterium]
MKKNTIIYVVSGTLLMLLLGNVYSYSMFRIEIEHYFGVNELKSGLPYMFILFFYALFMFVSGILYRKFESAYIAYTGVFLVSFGYILSYFASSIFLLTLTYGVLIGSGIGILYLLPLRIISELNTNKPGFITGIVLMGFGLSSLIFAPLINSSINSVGLHHTFLYLGVTYVFLLSILVNILLKKESKAEDSHIIDFRVVKQKAFYKLYTLFFIGTFIGLTLIGLTANIGVKVVNLQAADVALLLGLFAIFNGIGRPLYGHLNDTFGFKMTGLISYTTLILSSVLSYLLIENSFIFIVSFILFYINFGGWLALAPGATLRLFGKPHYSLNYGLMFTAYGLGALIGTLFSGFIITFINLESLFLIMIFLAIIGIIITLTIPYNKKTLLSERK